MPAAAIPALTLAATVAGGVATGVMAHQQRKSAEREARAQREMQERVSLPGRYRVPFSGSQEDVFGQLGQALGGQFPKQMAESSFLPGMGFSESPVSLTDRLEKVRERMIARQNV